MRTRRSSDPRTVKTGPVSPPDAIEILMRGHHEIDEMFMQFETAADAARERLGARICQAVTVHSLLEEELFYPAAQVALGDSSARPLGEAKVEHAIVQMLIDEIKATASTDVLFDARFKVLRDYLTLHAGEEESELFPRVRQSGIDLRALGVRVARRRDELRADVKAEWAVRGSGAVTMPRRGSRAMRLPVSGSALRAR